VLLGRFLRLCHGVPLVADENHAQVIRVVAQNVVDENRRIEKTLLWNVKTSDSIEKCTSSPLGATLVSFATPERFFEIPLPPQHLFEIPL
jgi:hypothetical protein